MVRSVSTAEQKDAYNVKKIIILMTLRALVFVLYFLFLACDDGNPLKCNKADEEIECIQGYYFTGINCDSIF